MKIGVCILFSLAFSLKGLAFSSTNIAIIYQKNEYKSKLVEKFKAKYETNYILAIDILDNIQLYNPSQYNAVLILSYAQKGEPDFDVADYLNKYKNSKNIIYYCSVFLPGTDYGTRIKRDNIDAVTSSTVFFWDWLGFDSTFSIIDNKLQNILNK